MAKYIDQALLGLTDFEIIMCNGDYKEALRILLDKIEKAPAADVVERKKGKWILEEKRRKSSIYRCSVCGNFFTVRPDTLNGGRGDMNFCPNCGADNK